MPRKFPLGLVILVSLMGVRLSDAQVSVTDGLDRAVTLARPAERVAVLAPFAIDALLDLGVDPVLRAEIRGETPARWDGIEVLPVSHASGPSLEVLVAAGPDLVVVDQTFARFAEPIERTTGAAVLVCDTRSIESVRAGFSMLGELVGRPDEAASLVARMDADLAGVAELASERASELGQSPRVFAFFGTPGSSFAFLPDSYLGSMCELMGVELVSAGGPASKLFKGFAPFSLERVIAADPEVLLVVRHGEDSDAERRMREHPAWGSISAVRDGRVHVLDERLFVMYPGLNVAEAARSLERAVFEQGEPAPGVAGAAE